MKNINIFDNHIHTSLSIYGGCSNRFNLQLPKFDDPWKYWEINQKSLLDYQTHQLILQNMIASFLFAQSNTLYLSRLIDYKKTFFQSDSLLFDFNILTQKQYSYQQNMFIQKNNDTTVNNYSISMNKNTFFYIDSQTQIGCLQCRHNNCSFTITYDSLIRPINGLYIDLTADQTTTITIAFDSYILKQDLSVVSTIKLSKFKNYQLPMHQLLQTYYFDCTHSFNSITLSFNTTIYISHLYLK